MVGEVLTVREIKNSTKTEQTALRRKAQTDLFWLADSILRNKNSPPLLPRVHGTICDQLVKKDPTRPLEDWSPIKERVILSSRGTLKTVIESADVVQIILCDPNVRILLMSGKLDNAKTILKLVREHFETNEVLQFLFPEWCVPSSASSELFTSPAQNGVNYREATVSISTFEAVKAGGHYNWLKPDDVTNEINNATPEQTEKTIQQYDDLGPLLEPGGYIDFTGTRWAENDLPEIIRQRGEEYEKETGVKKVQYFCQPIWTVKPGTTVQQQKEIDERDRAGKLKPEDVILLWPEKLNAKFLWPQYRANYPKFACQYLLNPSMTKTGNFTQVLLQHQTRPLSEQPMPHRSWAFQNWDLAGLSGKPGVDFAFGICGLWEDTRRLYLIDCIMERFTSSTQATHAIINFYKKWNPLRMRIEDAHGSRNLEGQILNIAKEQNLNIQIDWVVPETTKNAKINRILDLVDPMQRDLIQFFAGMPNLEKLHKQFRDFHPKSKLHDDGPDCIAQLWRQYNNQIHPIGIQAMEPSSQVLTWEVKAPDPHADEDADIEWLKGFTVPSGAI